MARGARGPSVPVSQGGIPVHGGGLGGDSYVLIDSYEDQSLSEYTDQVSEYDIVDPTTLPTSWPAPHGQYVLRNQSGTAFSRIYSSPGDGLENYFSKGNTATFSIRSSGLDGGIRILFGVAGLGQYYAAQVGYGVGNLRLFKNESGNRTDLATDAGMSPSANTTGEIEIVWDDGSLGGSNNDITISYSEGGSTLSSISGNDNTYASSSGVGAVCYNNSSANLFVDFGRVEV